MAEAEPAPVVLEEKVEVAAAPAEEVVAALPLDDPPATIIEEAVEVVAEVVEQGADVVVEVAEVIETFAEKVEEVAAVATEVAEEVQAAEVIETFAEKVEEVAAVATEVAEEVKAVAEEVIAVAEEVKEAVAEVVIDEAPAAPAPCCAEEIQEAPVVVIEAIAPALTFVEPVSAVSLVEAVKAVAPPKYADLGKEARDLINKDFHTVKHLKVTSKSTNGFQFTTEKSYNSASGVVGASLETKYICSDSDWSLSSKWNTDSVLSNTVSVANQGLDGLNVDIDTCYSLISGKKSMKVKTAYTGSTIFHPTLDLDVADIAKPNVDFSLVLAHQGLHAGYQTCFDSSASKLVGHNVSLGYKKNNLVLTGAVENASKFIGSVYYNIKEGLSAAAHAEYTPGASPNITLCGKYDMGCDASIKAKVDQNLTLGGSYTQKIRPGVSLTSTCILNGKALDQGGHKVGMSLSFES